MQWSEDDLKAGPLLLKPEVVRSIPHRARRLRSLGTFAEPALEPEEQELAAAEPAAAEPAGAQPGAVLPKNVD